MKWLTNPNVLTARSHGARARRFGLAVVVFLGNAGCTSSSAILRMQPDFAIATQAGVASVSIRSPLPGMTDAETVHLVMAGMERAAPRSLIAGPVKAPFPAQRIVWHVAQTGSRGASRLIVNVFDAMTPYAYEEEVIA